MKKYEDLNFLLVIPARYASTRFPGKPLIDLGGKTMIERVYAQCAKAVDVSKIVIATEDERILHFCQERNLNCIITTDNCLTGTDRVAEVALKMDADFYINVQGDEPVFNPDDIITMLENISQNKGDIYNGFCPISNDYDYWSVSVPKVVTRLDCRLLYMSRAPIPGNKKSEFQFGYRQVCIYSFSKKALLDFSNQREKTPLENAEDIEINRFLELGYEVQMIPMTDDSIPVDYPEDVEKVLKRINDFR